MQERHTILIAGGVIIVIAALFLIFYPVPASQPILSENPTTPAYECNADGKICPDGSIVGRTGISCEFAACPDATSAIVTTSLGQEMTGLNVTINPIEVLEDSRCPADVQCIWAGQVRVRTVLSTEVSHGEHIFSIGTKQQFGDTDVTLVAVNPYPNAGSPTPSSSYRFVFEVTKR